MTLPDPTAVRSLAYGLLGVAGALCENAAAYSRLMAGQWRGPTADAARARLQGFSHPQARAAADLRRAAGALLLHAQVLEEAVLHLTRAEALEQQHALQQALDMSGPNPLELPLATPRPSYDPGAGPALEIAATLRAAAATMIEDSGTRAARVVADIADAAPVMISFTPRNLDLASIATSLPHVPVVGPVVAPIVGYVADNPGGVFERNSQWIDDHGGDTVGHALDAAGLVPGLGVVADIAHTGLDIAKGDWTGATFDVVGAIPGGGDAAKLAHDGARAAHGGIVAGKDTRLVGDGLTVSGIADKGHGVYEGIDKVAQWEHDEEKEAPPVSGLVGGGSLYDHLASAASGHPDGAVPDSRDLTWGLLTSPAVSWSAAGDYPRRRSVFPWEPQRWTGSVEVTQNGRLVTYAMSVSRGGRLLSPPRVMSSRPIPATPKPPRTPKPVER